MTLTDKPFSTRPQPLGTPPGGAAGPAVEPAPEPASRADPAPAPTPAAERPQHPRRARDQLWGLGALYWAWRARLKSLVAGTKPPACPEPPAAPAVEASAGPAPAATAGPGLAPTAAVFVVGCPRSGTSILSWALAAHPHFSTSDEADFLHYLYGQGLLRQAYERACADPSRGWLLANGVGYAEFAGAIGLGVDHLLASRAGQRRWILSDPGHLLMGDDLALMFPRAQFLVMVRDGRAVVASMLKSGFNTNWAKDMRAACQTWAHYIRSGQKFLQRYPQRATSLRLESVVQAPDRHFGDLLAFLGAPPSALPSQFFQANRINSSYGNAAPGDIRKRKDPQQLPRTPWQQWSRGDKDLFRAICGPVMVELGYDLDLD